jgi:hypothetical protein
MPVALKKGVALNGVQPEIVVAIMVCDAVLAARGIDTVLTSVTDGVHSPGSYHYAGFAFDLRTWAVDSDRSKLELVDAIREALTDEFDVVLEHSHIHVEMDLRKIAHRA